MWEKIQQEGSEKKSCSQTTVGIISHAKTASETSAHVLDCKALDDGSKAACCSKRAGEAPKASGDFEGVRNTSLVAYTLIAPIRFYRFAISPWFRPCCRFSPSCSMYAIEAIKTHGPIKGLLLASWRIVRCNPFCKGGVDQVPSKSL